MNRKPSYPTLLFVTLLYVSGTSKCEGTGLSADCLPGGGHGNEVTVCQCKTVGDINKCGYGTDVIITDIIFGTLNVERHCLSGISGACSTQIDCEYKMSDHCDDKQFLEILEQCNGRHSCTVHNSVSRNMLCTGMTVAADYTTVQYRCATSTDRPSFDVCGEGQAPLTGEKLAHLTSPSFPNPDFTNKNRLCCCNLTGIENFYLLHYNSGDTTDPHIQFGEFSTSGLQTVNFDNKLANVHINPNAKGTYFLTWQQDEKANSGVFLASLVGRGYTNVSVTCGTTGCPHLPLPPTRQATPTSDITVSPPTTIGGYSTPIAGNRGNTANTGNRGNMTNTGGHTTEADGDDKPSVGMYAGIAGGVVALIIVILIIVILIRRRRKQKQRGNEPNEIYTEPTKRGDGSKAFTSPGDYELQQPPVPTKSPNITDPDDDYTYVETQDPVPQPASIGDATKKPLIPKVPQGAYQIYGDPDSKAYQTLDDDLNANGVGQSAAAKQNDPAYQDYDETYQGCNNGGDSAPYQEYDASEPAEDYSYADRYRPTRIIQQVQDNPPALGNDYETSSYDYAAVGED